jgi:dephospho-CoA kinase
MNNIRSILREVFSLDPLDETILDKNVLKAIMMAGGPGSGKSYVLNLIQKNIYPPPKATDSDRILEAKLKSAKLPLKLNPAEKDIYNLQMTTRNKAMAVNAQVLNQYLNGFLPIIIDGTGKVLKRYLAQYDTLKSLGYDVMCVIVNTSLEVAQERNLQRTRSLPAPQIEEFWNMCQTNFPLIKEAIPNTLIVNNDPNQLDAQKLISTIDKFFKSPIQNPIGQELYKNKDQGPIIRDLPASSVHPFS